MKLPHTERCNLVRDDVVEASVSNAEVRVEVVVDDSNTIASVYLTPMKARRLAKALKKAAKKAEAAK